MVLPGQRIEEVKKEMGEPKKELAEYIDWTKWGQLDPNIEKQIKEFFEDVTTLTITTVGSDNEEIVTKIKLQGDVYSKTTLKGEKLLAYHERMASTSINLIKTYAQLAIATISVFLPWTGLKIDTSTLNDLKETIKTLGQVNASKEGGD